MASFGIPQVNITDFLDIDLKTLCKHYRRELDIAATKANALVAQTLDFVGKGYP